MECAGPLILSTAAGWWPASDSNPNQTLSSVRLGAVHEEKPGIDTRPLWGVGTELYSHPEFPALMERLGLVDYWKATDWGVFCRPDNNAVICDGHDLEDGALEALLSGDR